MVTLIWLHFTEETYFEAGSGDSEDGEDGEDERGLRTSE
jgi:hypothetical protein